MWIDNGEDFPFSNRLWIPDSPNNTTGLYDGNLFLKEPLTEPEKGCYFLTCAWCQKNDSWSFKSTSPAMWVDWFCSENECPIYPLPDYVCDDCRYPVKIVVSIKGRVDYEDYLQSDHWKKVRSNALKRAQKRCQLCSSRKRLEVHHNTYANLGHESPADVIVLCHQCHGKHHGKTK